MHYKLDENLDFPALCEEVADYWEEKKIFEKSLSPARGGGGGAAGNGRGARQGARQGTADRQTGNGTINHEIRRRSKSYGGHTIEPFNHQRHGVTFYDGPPFPTGTPHHGTIFVSILKDALARFFTMRGYTVPRRWGWDCHGLPIENKVEQQLGVNKSEIGKSVSVKAFNAACRDYVSNCNDAWETYINKIGRWVDYKNSYKTLDTTYMDSVLWVFKTCYDKGLIYKDYRVTPYCWQCGTSLSLSDTRESDSMRPRQDPELTVKFKAQETFEGRDMYFLAWTTTPWTLPSNLFLAVGEDFDYVAVEHDNDVWVLAEAALPRYKDELGEQPPVLKRFKGSELVGKRYEPMFSYFEGSAKRRESSGLSSGLSSGDHREVADATRSPLLATQAAGNGYFQVLPADFVTLDDGVGVVHVAPAFGEDDYWLAKRHGYGVCNPVDEQGRFTDAVTDFAGRNVLEANPDVIKLLKSQGRVVRHRTLTHNYPHCWRCREPLIYRADDAWYFAVEKIKDDLLAQNRQINWVPESLREGRFGKWLEGARDWNLSRTRFWGTPLPVWECGNTDCGHVTVLGSVEEIRGKAGEGQIPKYPNTPSQRLARLRRETPDEIRNIGEARTSNPPSPRLPPSFDYGVTGRRDRQSNVEDNDGQNPNDPMTAQPNDERQFEKLSELELTDLHKEVLDEVRFPCEKCGTMMTRVPEVLDCWFESASMPYGQCHYPFENKDWFEANFPADFIVEYPGQLRGWFYYLHVLSVALFERPAFRNCLVHGTLLAEDGTKLSKSRNNFTDPMELIDTYGADALRLYLLDSPAAVMNDLRFRDEGIVEMTRRVLLPLWNAYSFFATYANIDGYAGTPEAIPGVRHESDRWILASLFKMEKEVCQAFETYHLNRSLSPALEFLDDLTNWYIRRSRERFWRNGMDDDKRQAYDTLYYVLVSLSKILAPSTPFVAEKIYRNLTGEESVHLAGWPDIPAAFDDPVLVEETALVRKVAGLGLSLRQKKKIRVRQPLRRLFVALPNSCSALGESHLELLKSELNVKEIEVYENPEDIAMLRAVPNAAKLGPVYGGEMQQIIQSAREGRVLRNPQNNTVTVFSSSNEWVLEEADIEIGYRGKDGLDVASDAGILVGLDTEITPELREEGMVNDLNRCVQELRKEAGYAVSDRILLDIRGPLSETQRQQLADSALAELAGLTADSADKSTRTTIDGREFEISVSKS